MNPSKNQGGCPRATVALTALIVTLALPSAALAQDPAGDQYAPTPPSGAGYTPQAQPNDPVPTLGNGGDNSGATNSTPDPAKAIPEPAAATPAPADLTSPVVAANTRPIRGGNKAQRIVRKLAGIAVRGPQAQPSNAGDAPQPTAVQLSNDNAAGAGMGIVLWIVLGGTLLWAIASGISSFRTGRADRHEVGSGDALRQSGSVAHRSDSGNGQVA